MIPTIPGTEIPITEKTYASAKWCLYQACGWDPFAPRTPFDYILVQGPRQVTDQVIRLYFGHAGPIEAPEDDDEGRTVAFSVQDDIEWPDWLMTQFSVRTLAVVKADALPYILSGAWPPRLVWQPRRVDGR